MSFLLRFNRITLSTLLRNISTSKIILLPMLKYTQNQVNAAPLELLPKIQVRWKKGFAKAYESHSDALKPKEEPQDTESFASLLENSKL
ncbi:hypothetical protein DOY81_009328 [Sarcophaga bullata]|nr:hypothetical protein DOY81_009328 [Sarcophaga bullata]